MDLEGKGVVITGGATGIGRATAVDCGSQRARVVVADVNESDGQRVVEQIRRDGGEAWFVRADVSDESQVEALMGEADRVLGGVSALVTAAGIARDSLVPVDEFQKGSWDQHVSVNLTGTFLAAKYVVPVMRRDGGGVIVMIASGAGVRGGSSIVAYGASKGGVNGLGMTLEQALAKDNIRVNVLCPGNISTPLKLGIISQQVERIGEAADESS